MKDGFRFRSSAFEIEAGEDEETNPRRYGRQLAFWIKRKFEGLGYKVEEVIPEDWGWCVMCQRKPYSLWIGCGNREDYSTAKEGDPPPQGSEVIWECFPMVEVPLLGRLFKKIDSSAGLDKLDQELKEVLTKEPSITFVDE